jgi:5-formyltetrahydrofolate cyclo-ligase
MMGLGFEEIIVILILSILLFDAKQVAQALKWLRTTKNKLANLQYDIEQKLEGVIEETIQVTPIAKNNFDPELQNSEEINKKADPEQTVQISATQKLRKQINFRIDQTPQDELQKASNQILQKLITLEDYKNASQIIIYSSLKDEVQTQEMINHILRDLKEVLLPRINSETKIMEFCPIFNPTEQLQPGKYGILEPLSDIKAVETTHTNLILVPGRVFGIQGQRIGRGKGYYDKFLEKEKQAIRIGISFESQVTTALIPQFDHDQKMDFILTEKRLISSPRKKKDYDENITRS